MIPFKPVSERTAKAWKNGYQFIINTRNSLGHFQPPRYYTLTPSAPDEPFSMPCRGNDLSRWLYRKPYNLELHDEACLCRGKKHVKPAPL